MRTGVMFLLLASAISLLGEEISRSADVSPTWASCVTDEIRRGRETLAATLVQTKSAPEERARLVEAWHAEELRLEKQFRAARANSSPAPEGGASRDTAAPAMAEKEPPLEQDLLLADIHEIEKGTRDFQKSLETPNLTAELRAIQIEQFHQINREVLAELDDLKLQAARRLLPAGDASDGETETAEAPVATKPSGIQAEIERVMRDLSAVDPETRSRYLEQYAATLANMAQQLSLRNASQTTTESPETAQPQSQTTPDP